MEVKRCPICKKKAKKAKNPHWPFCSERCKKIDLGKWALGEYRIPGPPIGKESEEAGTDGGEGEGNGEGNGREGVGEKKGEKNVD